MEPGLLLKDMNPATQLNFVRNKTLPEALFNQSRTTVGTAIASVLLFVLVIVISLPIGTQRGNQSSVEASFTPLSVSSASSHSTVANKHLVRMPHSQVETTFSPIEVMQKDATKNSEMSAEDAAHLAYMISSMSPNHERQVILYEIAISKGEADAAIWNNYGFSLVYVRRPEEARRAFIQSIQMNPKLLQPFFHLASLDGTCPGKFGAAPVGVSAFAALQRMPDEPIVRQLAVSALKALGAVDNGSVESQETANRLRVLLDGTRHLTLRQPISPYVVPYLCTQAEVVVDVKPIP